MVAFNDLKKGSKYRVRYRSKTMQVDREAVLVFLSRSLPEQRTLWSARPVLGTQDLPDEWVIDIQEVDSAIACYVDRKVRS